MAQRPERVKREVPARVGAIQQRGYIMSVVDAILGKTSSLNLDRAVYIQRQMTNVIKNAVSSSALAKDETVKKDLEAIASKIVAGSVKVTSAAFNHSVTYIDEAKAKANELATAADAARKEQERLDKEIAAEIAKLQREQEESAKETAEYVSATEAIQSDVNNAISFFG